MVDGTPGSIGATEQAIVSLLNPSAPVTEGYLNAWKAGFNSMNWTKRVPFYNRLIAAIEHLPVGYIPTPRLVERFAEVRQGNGALNYVLTGIAPNKGYIYDRALSSEAVSKALFGPAPEDVRSAVINQVRDWYTKTTVQAQDLAAAGDFNGTLNFAARQIQNMESSDHIVEWNLGLNLIFAAAREGLGKEVKLPRPVDGTSGQQFSAALGTAVASITTPSTDWNPFRIEKMFAKSDLVAIVKSSVWQGLRTGQYASAFNTEYMASIGNDQWVEISDSKWPADLDDVLFILVSKANEGPDSTLVIVDNHIGNSVENIEVFQRANHFRTHNSVFGINPHAVFAVFREGVPTLTSSAVPVPVDIDFDLYLNGAPVTEVNRGWNYDVVVNVKDADGFTAGRADIAIAGSESTDAETYVAVNDLRVYVGLDEGASTLTFTATSSVDTSVKASVTKPVVGPRRLVRPPYTDPGDGDNGGGDGGGGTEVPTLNLNPTNIAQFTGNTANPGNVIGDYQLRYSGTVGGQPVTTTPPPLFTQPVTLTQAGDLITVTAYANPAVLKLTGTTTRTLEFQAG